MYFWALVKKVVQQVEDLSFFLLFLLFYKKVKKSEKKYKKVFSTFPDAAFSPCDIHNERKDTVGLTSFCYHSLGGQSSDIHGNAIDTLWNVYYIFAIFHKVCVCIEQEHQWLWPSDGPLPNR